MMMSTLIFDYSKYPYKAGDLQAENLEDYLRIPLEERLTAKYANVTATTLMIKINVGDDRKTILGKSLIASEGQLLDLRAAGIV